MLVRIYTRYKERKRPGKYLLCLLSLLPICIHVNFFITLMKKVYFPSRKFSSESDMKHRWQLRKTSLSDRSWTLFKCRSYSEKNTWYTNSALRIKLPCTVNSGMGEAWAHANNKQLSSQVSQSGPVILGWSSVECAAFHFQPFDGDVRGWPKVPRSQCLLFRSICGHLLMPVKMPRSPQARLRLLFFLVL